MPWDFTVFTICVTIHLKKQKSRNEIKQTAAFDKQSSDTLTACILEDKTMHFSLVVTTKICWFLK